MLKHTVHRAGTGCLGALVALLAVTAARADVITDWNQKAEAIHIAKQRLTPAGAAREMAILHVSMFEAETPLSGDTRPTSSI